MTDAGADNPYAPPSAEILTELGSSYARVENNFLVVPRDWRSPRVCLLSGVTENLRQIRRKQVSWSHPAWNLLILLGPFGILLLPFTAKHARILVYLSRKEMARRRRKLGIIWGITAAGLALLFCGAVSGHVLDDLSLQLMLGGMLLLILAAVLGFTWGSLVHPRRIDQQGVWLAKVPPQVRQTILRMEQQEREQERNDVTWP